MSANIQSMAYYGEKPWHDFGTKVESAMTAQEAIKAAGLDWTVKLEPVFTAKGPLEGYHAVTRDDNNEVLGMVQGRYRPLQNKEAFSFFDSIVGEKAAMYHTAGALGKGERIWMLAKLPGTIQIINDDVTDKYLLLANSHDGTMKVTVMLTPIRVVCQNTLNGALHSLATRASLKHTESIGLKIEEVRQTLGMVNSRFNEFQEIGKRLAVTDLTKQAFKDYVRHTLNVSDTDQSDLPTRTKNILEKVSELFETGRGTDIPGVRGTAWGAYNAITEYVDYHRPTKGDIGNRTKSLLFGSGSIIKERAWNKAVELIA